MASVTICAWSAGKSWITICHCKRTRSRVSKEDKAIYRMILEGMRGIFFIAFRKVPTKNIIFTYSLKPTLTFSGIPPRQWSIDFKIMTSQFPPDNMTKRQKDSIYKMIFFTLPWAKRSLHRAWNKGEPKSSYGEFALPSFLADITLPWQQAIPSRFEISYGSPASQIREWHRGMSDIVSKVSRMW